MNYFKTSIEITLRKMNKNVEFWLGAVSDSGLHRIPLYSFYRKRPPKRSREAFRFNFQKTPNCYAICAA